ncbi:MAG: holo-ACP synthase [Acetobacter sp.]|nr:holo-ACP synthase [Acetobacter sp.]
MILGLGCDIVQISRFAKGEAFLQRFMHKYFTINEIREVGRKHHIPSYEELMVIVATRFAAKEAVVKALGTGFSRGITLKDIEVCHDSQGKPEIILYGNALARAYEMTSKQAYKVYLSLSNEREYANAVAVIEQQ